MIRLEHVSKSYNVGTEFETKVFKDFNLSIENNEFVTIIGPNGSGKSTLFNIISGNVDIEEGKIFLKDKNITKEKEYKRYKYIGRVYQNPSVGTCPNMTILENLALVDNKMKKYDLSWCVNKQKIDEYKEKLKVLKLGLENHLNTKVQNLSGGQQQAISLLMATINPIDILILDEHTAALDPKTAEIIMKLTDKIVKEHKITTLMITHNLKYAINYGSRLLVLKQGKIVLDRKGKENKNTKYEELIDKFDCF